MSIAIFNNDISTKQNIALNRLSNLIDITLSRGLENNILLSGRIGIINEYNNTVQGEFNGYTTIYRTFEDNPLRYQLSNDGSVYIEPDVEPDKSTLDEVINKKISEFSSICNIMILNGVDVEINGEIEHFSYTDEDQANIDDLASAAKTTKMEQAYHADGASCKLYTAEQMINIYMSEKMNKAHHTTYFNQMKMYILTLDDINLITNINYGDALTGQYLDTYNLMMSQTKKVANAMIGIKDESSTSDGTI